MIKSFKFASTPQIFFGEGQIAVLCKEIKQRSSIALIVTGGKSFIETKHWQSLKKELSSADITFSNEAITNEPSPQVIDKIVEKHQPQLPGVVVAIGGGSVLDAGKAISAMLPLNESIINFLEGIGRKQHPGTKIPFIAIPTTSGTGSETTKNAVISQVGINGFKKSLRHNNFVPDVAIVDPVLTMSCSPSLKASCGMDAFTQLLESYVSTAASPMTDALAFEGLEKICQSIEFAFEGSDVYMKLLQAHRDLALASMLSGITLANAGLGITHGLASVIGGFFDIPHGVVCGTLMGEANKITIEKLQKKDPDNIALQKYAKVGKLFSESKDEDADFYCKLLCNKIDELNTKMSMPHLSEYGITANHVEEIAGYASNKNNPIELTKKEITTILKSRL